MLGVVGRAPPEQLTGESGIFFVGKGRLLNRGPPFERIEFQILG